MHRKLGFGSKLRERKDRKLVWLVGHPPRAKLRRVQAGAHDAPRPTATDSLAALPALARDGGKRRSVVAILAALAALATASATPKTTRERLDLQLSLERKVAWVEVG